MKPVINSDTIKFTAGAIIVATAAFMMVPGLTGYFASLGRISVMIGLVLILCSILVFLTRQISNLKNKAMSKSAGSTAATTPSNPSSNNQ